MDINFDDLYANRIYYLDITTDEYLIIKYLKLKLIENNFSLDLIDEFLFHFYTSLSIPISLEEIKLIQVDEDDNESNNTITPENITDLLNHLNQVSYIYSLITPIAIIIPNSDTSEEFEDVVVTTDKIESINSIIVEDNINDKCSICLLSIDKGDTILDIECKHYFHKECLVAYLKEYNHICPICRADIGSSKINY
jgi:hypothetical protein